MSLLFSREFGNTTPTEVKKMKFRLYATLALLVSVPLTTSAQSGTIAGQVTDSDGEVIVGAIVAVLGLPLKLGASTGTDGEFTIGSVPAGTHMVEASLIGYDDESREVTVTSGQTVTVNFALSQGALLLNAIVVTGKRSGGRTAMQSATPIDYLEGEELDRQGNGDLTETLKNQVPSYAATPLTGDGAAFIRSTSLRGLPPDDVLFLMNSKRRHRSALIAHFGAAMNVGAHSADIGQIPSIALKSVEVLRDGAAAQ